MAVSVETNLLARNIFVIDVRTVAQRFSVQGAEIVEVAALILFAVPGFRQHRPSDPRKGGGPGLRRRDLQGQRVDDFQAADAVGFPGFILGAAGNVGEGNIGIAVILWIQQHGQSKGDIFRGERRAVAEGQIRPQLDGIHFVVGAHLPAFGQARDQVAVAVPVNQA